MTAHAHLAHADAGIDSNEAGASVERRTSAEYAEAAGKGLD
jgi:hypothetical protein